MGEIAQGGSRVSTTRYVFCRCCSTSGSARQATGDRLRVRPTYIPVLIARPECMICLLTYKYTTVEQDGGQDRTNERVPDGEQPAEGTEYRSLIHHIPD